MAGYYTEQESEMSPVRQINYDDAHLEEATGVQTKSLVDDERAKYKIEIRFGSQRSKSHMIARIDLWESGRSLAGGGDNHMFICGYDDCQAPIPPDNVGRTVVTRAHSDLQTMYEHHGLSDHWAICPVCLSKGRNNNGKQVASPEAAGYVLNEKMNRMDKKIQESHVVDPISKIKYPCIKDCMFIAATPRVIAESLARMWESMDGNADIYMKYNPNNIKAQYYTGYYNEDRGDWDEKDVLAIYPLANILKDTQAGSSLVSRFESFILS
jgi:hypothetical protein